MKKYRVSLARSYVVTIEAESEEKACKYAEFYIGNCCDASTFEERQKNKFSIVEIEPTINEAVDVEEAEE